MSQPLARAPCPCGQPWCTRPVAPPGAAQRVGGLANYGAQGVAVSCRGCYCVECFGEAGCPGRAGWI